MTITTNSTEKVTFIRVDNRYHCVTPSQFKDFEKRLNAEQITKEEYLKGIKGAR